MTQSSPALNPAFAWSGGELHAEGVPLSRIAAAVGTPAFCYSARALEANANAYRQALDGVTGPDGPGHLLCYAVKANSNQAVISTFAAMGLGADVVSEGELKRALAAGVAPERIVFAGVGKTEAELAMGLDAGILQFNVESEPELRALSAVAAARGATASVALRVNPDVDAATHAKISTGKSENKFGIPIDRVRALSAAAAALPGVRIDGLSVHIGSQLTSLEPYRAAFAKLAELARALRQDGVAVSRLDLGGGLGIVYDGEESVSLARYAALVREVIAPLGCRLIFEPGRSLVGDAGVLVTRVIYVKEGGSRRFVVVDAAMNDLIRPTLYDAYHDVVPVFAPGGPDAGSEQPLPADLVGPICETGDTFATDRALPAVAAGDLLAICSAGAYGAVMASTYNTRALAPEVLVRGDGHAVVRPRLDTDAVIAMDRLPPWLSGGGRTERGAA